ncbi:unnamed protein product [Phyllotreta striolata]|uniref:Uncharacterized protein n=1 Tax=Phyllotreta striolata TaxID=444603 RepID=A0A9P0GTH3_PHYSR|nr:unnamed protein product [Phyllotreta striolata]
MICIKLAILLSVSAAILASPLPVPDLTLSTAPIKLGRQLSSDLDDLDTADMIIFRPLFVYRKRTAEKYKLRNAIDSNRRIFTRRRRIYRPYY